MYKFESTKIIFVGSNLKKYIEKKIFKLRKDRKWKQFFDQYFVWYSTVIWGCKTYLIINTNLQSLSTQLEAVALMLLTPLLMEGRMKLWPKAYDSDEMVYHIYIVMALSYPFNIVSLWLVVLQIQE